MMEHIRFTTVVILAALIVYGAEGQGNGYCKVTKPSTATVAPESKLPVLPIAFRTKVEANFVDMNLTSTIDEYYDSDGNRGALSIYAHDTMIRIIYSYKTGEIFNIADDNTCVVTNITKDNFLFGDTTVDGRNHIFTSNDVFKIGGGWSEVTENQTTIRGISVRQWQTCQYWDVFKATFTVNYYFSDINWTPSDNFSPTPVRAHVKGQIVDGTVTRNFEHYYDYFDFRMNIGDDLSMFQTPDRVVCLGRKKTKKIPSFPDHYYYREEIIEPDLGRIEYADVWYDYENKMVRYDYHHPGLQAPFNNGHPVSEVHDYNSGVAYVMDKELGTCYTYGIKNSTFDVSFNATVWKTNGSYSIRMKNPLHLLYLDAAYTFEGQTTVRGAICDRFVSLRNDFILPGAETLGKLNSTFTYYFLSTDEFDVTNTGDDTDNQAPFRLEISIDSLNYLAIYNFLDFDTEQPPFTDYDISRCYSEYDQLKLQLRFPVSYSNEESKALALEAQLQLVVTLGISPLRIQDVSIDYDNSNMYLKATLLGPPPPGAEFTYVPGETQGTSYKAYSDVTDPSICAQYCVEDTDASCKSYDLCTSDKTCTLSSNHAGNQTKGNTAKQCNHFSRTVDGTYVRQTPLLEVWGTLSEKVATAQLLLQVPDGDNGETIPVAAISAEITYGHLYDAAIPSITGQYYYRQEIAIPNVNMIQQADVWYDATTKLVRYDQRSTTAKAPFYTTNPMTVIHDFNTGLQYNIDKLLGNCSITAIQNDTFDTTANLTEKLKDGTFVSRMKNPLELFFLDSSYIAAGQRSVRGVLCNVFESQRTDYRLPGIKGPINATFQYFFLADTWTDVSNAAKAQDQDVPIRLDIIVPSLGFLSTYNFFDFEETKPSLKKFDVGPCYPDDQKVRFQIQFNRTYHPYLDSTRAYFEFAVRTTMAEYMEITPLRIQDSRIDYDDSNVYFTATLLDRSPPSDQYVVATGYSADYADDKTLTGVTNPDVCAVYCSLEKSFPCNSFDLCPIEQKCALSRKHSSEGKLVTNSKCLHFSRDVDAPAMVEIALAESWDALRDFVFKGVISVQIPYITKLYTFQAVSIKDVLFTDVPPVLQEENNMKKFKVFKTNTAFTDQRYILPQLSVDDCATACIAEENFDCEAFDYCYDNGNCFLSITHPNGAPANFSTPTRLCDLYGRNYVDDYTEMPGKTVLQKGAKTVENIKSADECARLCERETTFVCKSFDFCGMETRCTLGKKHIFDLPITDIEQHPQCSHYSRRYVDDFRAALGKVVIFTNNYIINDVSNEECAKLCVEEESFSCRGFDFCANTTQCRLTAPRLDGIGQVTIQDSAYCNHFTRQYFPDGTPYNRKPTHIPQTNNKNSGYSGATMAAVAMSVGVVAVIASVVIVVIVQRRRNRGPDHFSGTVNFTKHMDE